MGRSWAVGCFPHTHDTDLFSLLRNSGMAPLWFNPCADVLTHRVITQSGIIPISFNISCLSPGKFRADSGICSPSSFVNTEAKNPFIF